MDHTGELERGEAEGLPNRIAGRSLNVTIDGHDLYMHMTDFSDGRLGNLVLDLSDKSPPALRETIRMLGETISIGLKFGAPIEKFIEAYEGHRSSPSGEVKGDDEIVYCTSILDYIAKRLSRDYADKQLVAPAPKPGRPQSRFAVIDGGLERKGATPPPQPGA